MTSKSEFKRTEVLRGAAREARRKQILGRTKCEGGAVFAAQIFEEQQVSEEHLVTAALAGDRYDWFDLVRIEAGPKSLAKAVKKAVEFRGDPRLAEFEITIYRGNRAEGGLAEVARFGELV